MNFNEIPHDKLIAHFCARPELVEGYVRINRALQELSREKKYLLSNSVSPLSQDKSAILKIALCARILRQAQDERKLLILIK